ncbi:MAG: hypothetical protein U9O89_02225 [Thermoproteota archaeon]|nr:hypothetical protein [Thermoproteota archaeon]
MRELKVKKNVQKWIEGSLNDPIVKILIKNSHLTETQIETLLIDVLATNLSEKQLKYEEKARLRLGKTKVSRGAFNRTLKQAQKNVIKSIYTIFLLGYLGVFEHTSLDSYLEIANKLETYITTYRNTLGTLKGSDEKAKAINSFREELQVVLEQLSRP